MEYEKSDVLLEEDENDPHSDVELPLNILYDEDDDLDVEELALADDLDKKTKTLPPRFSLEKRRAIEDYLEQRRLREEFDYEFESEVADQNKATESE
ncbi:PA3496 family putative envelope integrity protein [Rickettsiella massiliensis]|uniref:PA3496 family putative envelope integrity protein n=1 Tax=Rickettsiella massiliensis TaxID=676517 RepID=UPI000299FB53|nr:hypothetical protein [Rickettsiella massiliensis]